MQATWDKKKILFWHLFSLILLLSWFIPATRSLWNTIDKQSFYFFNSLISDYHPVHLFWAFCNTRTNDWLFDVVVLLIFTSYVLYSPKETRKERGLQLFITVLFVAVLLIIKHFIFRVFIHIYRPSPIAILPGIQLGDYISSIPIKGACYNSYPGDHAFTACVFIITCCFMTDRFWAFISILFTLPLLLLPRLVIGAHWLTDIIMGSFILSIIPMSWICYSPLLPQIMKKIRVNYGKTANPRPH